MLKTKIIPEFNDEQMKEWAKPGVTAEFLFNTLKEKIHPIHWVQEKIVQDLLNEYILRMCYSVDKKYYKLNYGNASFNDFVKYPFLFFCRGDVLYVDSDIIVHKAVNKIWNLNENQLTLQNKIPSEDIACIEKMDGMLIIPFYDETTNTWRLTSRGSFEFDIIPVAEKYFKDNYIQFCDEMRKRGLYPSFEIISRESFIKVEYDSLKFGLYFLGCCNIFGEIDYENIHEHMEMAESMLLKTPKVFTLKNTITDTISFVNSFDKYYFFEGVVVTFKDGSGSVKIKSDKYFEMNIQKLTNTEYIYDLWNENEIDDVIAHVPPLLGQEIIDRVEKFKTIKKKLVDKYMDIETTLKELPDQKSVAEYLQTNVDSKYFHFFINKFKNNVQAIERNRKNFILAHFEE